METPGSQWAKANQGPLADEMPVKAQVTAHGKLDLKAANGGALPKSSRGRAKNRSSASRRKSSTSPKDGPLTRWLKTSESTEHVKTDTRKGIGTDEDRDTGIDTTTDFWTATSPAAAPGFGLPNGVRNFTFGLSSAQDGAASDKKHPAPIRDRRPSLDSAKPASAPNSEDPFCPSPPEGLSSSQLQAGPRIKLSDFDSHYDQTSLRGRQKAFPSGIFHQEGTADQSNLSNSVSGDAALHGLSANGRTSSRRC
jgi:hypothetical protein